MNTTQPLNNILFLLDEVSLCKQRLGMATEITRDIEIAVLQSKIIALYTEIQQYNRLALQPSVPQATSAVNSPTHLKETASMQQAQVTAPKQEPAPAETQAPAAQPVQQQIKPEPVEEKQQPEPKPMVQAQQHAPTQQPAPRKEITDFERKREKLLREEAEFNATQQANANQDNQVTQTQQATPQFVQPRPEPVRQQEQIIAQTATAPEVRIEQPQPAPAAEPEQTRQTEVNIPQPQPFKENVQPNNSQPQTSLKDRLSTVGTEKSLNEKLAGQSKTSLNDKFQTHVKKNLADKLKLSPISDLRTAININQRVAFINQLFKGDDKEFKNVVSTVNGFKNFSEAKFFIQSEVSPRFSWNDEDAAVQEFMELVYRKFL